MGKDAIRLNETQNPGRETSEIVGDIIVKRRPTTRGGGARAGITMLEGARRREAETTQRGDSQFRVIPVSDGGDLILRGLGTRHGRE